MTIFTQASFTFTFTLKQLQGIFISFQRLLFKFEFVDHLMPYKFNSNIQSYSAVILIFFKPFIDQMKQSAQTPKTSNSSNKEILDQSEVCFNILQTQPHYLHFSITQIENAIQQNIAVYFQLGSDKEHMERQLQREQSNTVNKDLDSILKRMISKIESKLCQLRQTQKTSLAKNLDVFKNRKLSQCQSGECEQIIKKMQSQNQNILSKNLELKTQIRELKNTILVLNQAYIESRNHFKQEIKELQKKNLIKQENERFQKGNPYLLNMPRTETLRSHQIQTVKHISFRQPRQSNHITRSQQCQKYQMRTNQAKSIKESSIQSKKSVQHFQLKISRISEQNKRIRQCLNQTSCKLRNEIKNTDKLTKQLERLICQNTKLQESNLKKKAIIDKLMKAIQKKYQIFKKE